jgi:hypothetical protein
MGCMEPFRIISTIEEFAGLRVNSIVCPTFRPASAYRKAWGGYPSEGKADIFVTFESTRESDLNEVWAILTTHCPEDAPEIWVLWDAAAQAPEPLKPGSWTSIIPSRRPATKAHTSLGYAKAAVSHRVHDSKGAAADMAIQELNPATGKFEPLFAIPAGTSKAQLPW